MGWRTNPWETRTLNEWKTHTSGFYYQISPSRHSAALAVCPQWPPVVTIHLLFWINQLAYTNVVDLKRLPKAFIPVFNNLSRQRSPSPHILKYWNQSLGVLMSFMVEFNSRSFLYPSCSKQSYFEEAPLSRLFFASRQSSQTKLVDFRPHEQNKIIMRLKNRNRLLVLKEKLKLYAIYATEYK